MTTFNLEQSHLDLLFTGLRYLEINHPSKREFSRLLDTIYIQCNQTELFSIKNEGAETYQSESSSAIQQRNRPIHQ